MYPCVPFAVLCLCFGRDRPRMWCTLLGTTVVVVRRRPLVITMDAVAQRQHPRIHTYVASFPSFRLHISSCKVNLSPNQTISQHGCRRPFSDCSSSSGVRRHGRQRRGPEPQHERWQHQIRRQVRSYTPTQYRTVWVGTKGPIRFPPLAPSIRAVLRACWCGGGA